MTEPLPAFGPQDMAGMLAELVKNVDPKHRDRFMEITSLTDEFCLGNLQPLHLEYQLYCQGLAAACCQAGSPVVEGKAKASTWAAAIVYTIGWVNFLTDPEAEPTMTAADVASAFGISAATMQKRSSEIRRGLDIVQFEPEWTLPSMLIHNPMVWFAETEGGMVVDIRHLPREQQEAAFEAGLIPFVPADLEEMMSAIENEGPAMPDQEDQDLPPDVIGRLYPSD